MDDVGYIHFLQVIKMESELLERVEEEGVYFCVGVKTDLVLFERYLG